MWDNEKFVYFLIIGTISFFGVTEYFIIRVLCCVTFFKYPQMYKYQIQLACFLSWANSLKSIFVGVRWDISETMHSNVYFCFLIIRKFSQNCSNALIPSKNYKWIIYRRISATSLRKRGLWVFHTVTSFLAQGTFSSSHKCQRNSIAACGACVPSQTSSGYSSSCEIALSSKSRKRATRWDNTARL